MTRVVVGDIGGTNARFADAHVVDGRVVAIGEPVVFATARQEGLASAWRAFIAASGGPPPRRAAFAVAGPIDGGPIRFVNSHWVIDPRGLATELGLDAALLLNDFGAMAHAVDALDPGYLAPVCGPDAPLPDRGAISVIGVGTGLGVAVLQRRPKGPVVLETEGGHTAFAPLDDDERRVRDSLAAEIGRVSVERVVSGPGLGAIVRAFAPGDRRNDAALWAAAIGGEDAQCATALGVLLRCYGAAVGDLSLAHGSTAVVLTGGLTQRLADAIAPSGFHARFCAKGRYRTRMTAIPIKHVTHPQPGLFGAAAALAREDLP